MNDCNPPTSSTATDPALRLVRRLYDDEAPRDEELDALLASDEALRAEYEVLRAVKARLDGRPRQRPRPETVERIAAAAAQQTEAARRKPRADRAAVARGGTRRRVAGVAGMLLATALAFVVGVWQPLSLGEAWLGAEEESAVAPAAKEPPREVVLAWNEDDEVHRLYRRIELLEARMLGAPADEQGDGLGWGRPVAIEQNAYAWDRPLDALAHPASGSSAAGAARPAGTSPGGS